jgi:hypothetical protein
VGSAGHNVEPPAGWQTTDFDDSSWEPAVMHSGPRDDRWGYGPSTSANGDNNIWTTVAGHGNAGIR